MSDRKPGLFRNRLSMVGAGLAVLATLNLAVKVRWPLWTTVGTLLAGTIPLLGIILEHFRTRQVKQQFNLEAPQALAAPEAKASAPDPDARSRPSARE